MTLQLSSPPQEFTGGIRLTSPASNTIQIRPAPHTVLQWSTPKGSGKPFIRKLSTSASLATPQRLAVDKSFTDGLVALNEGQYTTARSKFQEALRLCKTAQEAYALGQQLTSLELYGLAQTALLQAEIADERLKEPNAEWQRLYFPTTLLPSDKEALFATAVYDTQKTPAEKMALLQQLTKMAPDFSPAWRSLGLAQINAWLTQFPGLLPAARLSPIDGLKNLKRAASLSPGCVTELEAWGDGAALAKQYSLAMETYALAQANLPKESRDTLWEGLEGKRIQAQGNLKLQQFGPSGAAWRTVAEGLQRQNRPIEYFQALQEAQRVDAQKLGNVSSSSNKLGL